MIALRSLRSRSRPRPYCLPFTTWYMCHFCNRAFTDVNKLLLHKDEQHVISNSIKECDGGEEDEQLWLKQSLELRQLKEPSEQLDIDSYSTRESIDVELVEAHSGSTDFYCYTNVITAGTSPPSSNNSESFSVSVDTINNTVDFALVQDFIGEEKTGSDSSATVEIENTECEREVEPQDDEPAVEESTIEKSNVAIETENNQHPDEDDIQFISETVLIKDDDAGIPILPKRRRGRPKRLIHPFSSRKPMSSTLVRQTLKNLSKKIISRRAKKSLQKNLQSRELTIFPILNADGGARENVEKNKSVLDDSFHELTVTALSTKVGGIRKSVVASAIKIARSVKSDQLHNLRSIPIPNLLPKPRSSPTSSSSESITLSEIANAEGFEVININADDVNTGSTVLLDEGKEIRQNSRRSCTRKVSYADMVDFICLICNKRFDKATDWQAHETNCLDARIEGNKVTEQVVKVDENSLSQDSAEISNKRMSFHKEVLQDPEAVPQKEALDPTSSQRLDATVKSLFCRYCNAKLDSELPLYYHELFCKTKTKKYQYKIKPFECNICKKKFFSQRCSERCTRKHQKGIYIKMNSLSLEDNQLGKKNLAISTVPDQLQTTPAITVDKPIESNPQNLELPSPTDSENNGTTCSHCKLPFITKASLQSHQTLCWLLKASDEKMFECEICQKQFTDNGNLTQHMRLKHASKVERKTFKCNVCQKEFEYRLCFEKHLLLHGAADPASQAQPAFRSLVSNVGFHQKAQLQEHENEEHPTVHVPVTTNTCALCKKIFNSTRVFNNHLKNCHVLSFEDKKTFQCSMCERVFNSVESLKRHKVLLDHYRTIICKVKNCGKTFLHISELQIHLRVEHQKLVPSTPEPECSEPVPEMMNLKTWKCYVCSKTFLSTQGLLKHYASAHSTSRPSDGAFKCRFEDCATVFKGDIESVEHQRIHGESTGYKCSVCGNIYLRERSFRKHERAHKTDHYQVLCHLCPKKFLDTQDLEKHLASAYCHFQCKVCKVECYTKAKLTEHRKTHKENQEISDSSDSDEESGSTCTSTEDATDNEDCDSNSQKSDNNEVTIIE